MTKRGSPKGKSPSHLIDARIKELGDWRGQMLSRLRALVKEADPDVVEEWKWRGVPVWSHHGLICTGETYKNAVKMTFARGAALEDPSGLFNSSLGGNTRRAIDFHEGEKMDGTALKALIRAAVALNASTARSRSRRPPSGSGMTPGEIHVAAASGLDDALVAAFRRLLPQLSRGAAVPTREMIREIVEAPATTVLVARDGRANGRIVGMLTLVVFRIPTGVRAWIEDVVVDERVRGRGVGEALSQEAIRRAVGLGARTVELTSRPSREAANRLYQRLGFVRRDSNVYRYTP